MYLTSSFIYDDAHVMMSQECVKIYLKAKHMEPHLKLHDFLKFRAHIEGRHSRSENFETKRG